MAKTVVFFSTKGGVGTTLIASNIALSLARDQSQRVLLIDSDITRALSNSASWQTWSTRVRRARRGLRGR